MKCVASINKNFGSYFIMVENENNGRRYLLCSLKCNNGVYSGYINFNERGPPITQKRLKELHKNWLDDPLSWEITGDYTPMKATWVKTYDRYDLVSYNKKYNKINRPKDDLSAAIMDQNPLSLNVKSSYIATSGMSYKEALKKPIDNTSVIRKEMEYWTIVRTLMRLEGIYRKPIIVNDKFQELKRMYDTEFSTSNNTTEHVICWTIKKLGMGCKTSFLNELTNEFSLGRAVGGR